MEERRRFALLALNAKYSRDTRRNAYFDRRRPQGLGNEEYLPKTLAEVEDEVCMTIATGRGSDPSVRVLTFGEVVDTIIAAMDLSGPNATTIAALREVLKGYIPRFEKVDALFADLNADDGFQLEGYHHVLLGIPADSDDRARSFWSDILGLREVAKPVELASRGGCWFRGNGIEVHCGVEKDFRPARKAHPGILVSHLGELATHFENHGITVSWDEEFPAFNRFYADDPFGNRIEFLEPKNRS
jgi:catechol 2,3-dioxygenase-like lactoylglutathione lyase family enzyme